MSFRYFYNDGGRAAAGFKGETSDCVCRAIAIASRRPYGEVYKRLADGQASVGGKRTARDGVHVEAPWFKSYMDELGFEWVPTVVHLSSDELPPGRIICEVSKHYVAVIDGIIHDASDCSRYGTHQVFGYWRQKDANDGARQPSGRKKMVDRVKALLAKTLANGCTEAEATAAMGKAAEIMAAHHVEESDLLPGQDEDVLMHATGTDDPYKVRWNLCSAIAVFTHCRTWRNSYGGEIVFCGLESDADFAEWLLGALADFVLREIENHLAERRRNGLPCPRYVSASFMHGITDRISERLRKLAPRDDPAGAGKDLVVSRRARVDAAMEKAGIKVRTVSLNYFARSEDCYTAGTAAGNRASFARPVSGAGATLRLGKIDVPRRPDADKGELNHDSKSIENRLRTGGARNVTHLRAPKWLLRGGVRRRGRSP